MQRTIEEIKIDLSHITRVFGSREDVEEFIQCFDELIETVATLQREKCAEEAKTVVYESGFPDETYNFKLSVEEVYVDKESILNAKL